MITTTQKRTITIFSVLAIVTLLLIAIITAIRLGQIGTEPVAPNAPKSKPRADVAIPTPGADSACRKTWTISEGPTGTPGPTSTPTPTGTPGPTSTPTPTGTPGPTSTPTPGPSAIPTPGMVCVDLDIPGGTSRNVNTNMTLICKGNPESDVTQCRFRFGDGSAEVFEDDCNVIKTYSQTGNYNLSCEVRDKNGNWHASADCEAKLEVLPSGQPTSTPAPIVKGPTKIPTVAQEKLPQAGNFMTTLGILSAGIGTILLGLLLIL